MFGKAALRRLLRSTLGVACVLALSASLAAARTHHPAHHSSKTTKNAKASHSRSHHRKAKVKRSSWRRRGQQKIDADRARQIQEALIRQNYLDGEPTGIWDQRTKEAMSRYQLDNGWQTKMIPDSRALIKLGLGPSHADLINPDTAMSTDPALLPAAGGSSSFANTRAMTDAPQQQ